MDLIKRGVVEIIPEEELVKKIENSIKTGKPLRVKLGCDPTRPDLHLGHSVVLRKLRHFQELGHIAILIIGDFTAMIGDPSGQNKTRPQLSFEETRVNGQTYFEQAKKILLPERVEIRYNSEWLGKMTFEDVIRLASKYTVARMLERDDFTKRYKSGEPISIHELLYPLAQAMDSVAIEADVELGGTDQKFNLLVGRDIQREFGQEPQVIITTPLLVGTDGVEKMSKSLGNYIALNDPPFEMYGKTMSIPDELIYDYFLLTTDLSPAEIEQIKKQLQDPNVNPRDLKRKLAWELVRMYHGVEAANKAQDEFDKIFVKKEIPDEIEEFEIDSKDEKIRLVDLLVHTKLASSKSEAKRLIQLGGVSIDGNRINDIDTIVELKESFVIKVGKRKFLRIKPKIKN
ncbi:tyrosyl-tRNA synthetase [Candidatus Kryptonium thompsonii]|jgi:tyrosyl-tRNA synthetase|uniref:Tyrosine--tRNA ligase n=2 Tax=Candidatus Kryptonium thompsonii TaxID=1633631 RepID=A0A0P1LBM4_9BACT|nr:tyrosine--tRNA ligase [Candidatus Kryptonium thompsoni]CUS78526.1 tyrosyl-tRNA synthetase [Candidatus Kryptonium thompsoni]CUS79984.1 tyrosyl-tRNA synthetase [Candidatus Kryptonium thompsoni]CUS83677.1 tyrosyl-tRNA synthetase [Candidatus Kryptonium thompsoni]CUT00999.1 tyrosyl-tRNA synthetase [Candidatus Kryptonium thompsoni]CUT05514.1 tyrosyl-tRNA synthetase [Candidatus Kryptonium thompsoni]